MIRSRSIICARCGRTWQVARECVVCSDCGESPANFEVRGVPFCGLHETAMQPFRVTGQFLRTTFTDDFRAAWKLFPNANLDGKAGPGQETIDAYCCAECERLLHSWETGQRGAGD